MVLAAMLENDEDLVDLIRQMQEAKGRGEKFNPKRLHEKIEVLGPAIDLSELRRSIDVEIVDQLGMGWDKWYGLLQKFHSRHGHARPESGHQESGVNLGMWVCKQREKKNRLTPDQLKRLNSLGFCWDPIAYLWEQGFAALEKFRKQEGHCRVVARRQVDGLNLGDWVSCQRTNKNELTPDRLNRLDALGFCWDARDEVWEQNFAALQKFCKREGHCLVVRWHKEDGLKLGTWVDAQRAKRDKLLPDKLKRLNSLGFNWDPLAEAWESYFAALQKFLKREGHVRVAQSHQENGLMLGTWVSNQRKKKNGLTPDKLKRLNSIGFSWDPLADDWEANFVALQRFRKREGHCRVAQLHKEGCFKLGVWVHAQRRKKNKLTPNQLKCLNSNGFVWNPRAETFEAYFEALHRFSKREGHCRAQKGHKENGLKLGDWVCNLRSKKNRLTPKQRKQLNSLGFSWDPFTELWEQGFTALQKFYKREGHCRVKKGHEEDGFKLGTWVGNRRRKKDNHTPDQLKRLNSLGFVWRK
jgi:hypothetical protein